MRYWIIGGLLMAVAGPAGVVVGRQWRAARDRALLAGQEATEERLVRTPSGGKPHYEPIQYRAKDSRPAILEPQFVGANDAHLVAGTMGIGVNVQGESRFYPLFVLQYHQIVNDTCGDKPIVCSY
jgi:hypothetical protein